MFVELNGEGRIMGTSEEEIEGWGQMELPEGFDRDRQSDYVVKDGECIYSPPGDLKPDEAEERLAAIEAAILELGEMMGGEV